MFTTPCFIRKNTPELRKKLEEFGYTNGAWANNPNSMYSVVGYYRYDENYSREKERENTIEPHTCSGEELKSAVDFFNQEWLEKFFEKAID